MLILTNNPKQYLKSLGLLDKARPARDISYVLDDEDHTIIQDYTVFLNTQPHLRIDNAVEADNKRNGRYLEYEVQGDMTEFFEGDSEHDNIDHFKSTKDAPYLSILARFQSAGYEVR